MLDKNFCLEGYNIHLILFEEKVLALVPWSIIVSLENSTNVLLHVSGVSKSKILETLEERGFEFLVKEVETKMGEFRAQ